MTETLAFAMARKGMVMSFAEARRGIAAKAVTVNDKPATSWDQKVNSGDIIKFGKYRTARV